MENKFSFSSSTVGAPTQEVAHPGFTLVSEVEKQMLLQQQQSSVSAPVSAVFGFSSFNNAPLFANQNAPQNTVGGKKLVSVSLFVVFFSKVVFYLLSANVEQAKSEFNKKRKLSTKAAARLAEDEDADVDDKVDEDDDEVKTTQAPKKARKSQSAKSTPAKSTGKGGSAKKASRKKAVASTNDDDDDDVEILLSSSAGDANNTPATIKLAKENDKEKEKALQEGLIHVPIPVHEALDILSRFKMSEGKVRVEGDPMTRRTGLRWMKLAQAKLVVELQNVRNNLTAAQQELHDVRQQLQQPQPVSSFPSPLVGVSNTDLLKRAAAAELAVAQANVLIAEHVEMIEQLADKVRTAEKKLNNTIESHGRQITDMKKMLTDNQKTLDIASNSAYNHKQEVEAMKTMIDLKTKSVSDMVEQLDESETKIIELNRENDEIKTQHDNMVVEYDAQIKSLQASLDEAVAAKVEARGSVERFTADLNAASQMNDALSGEVSELKKAIEALTSEKEALKAHYQERATQAIEECKNVLRSDFEAKQAENEKTIVEQRSRIEAFESFMSQWAPKK